jgi:hypothetical protein
MIQSIPVAVDLAVRILPWPLIVSLADRRALLFRRFSDCFPVPFSCVRLPGNPGSFKTERGRGNVIENIYIRDIRMQNITHEAININTFYTGPQAHGPSPLLRNVLALRHLQLGPWRDTEPGAPRSSAATRPLPFHTLSHSGLIVSPAASQCYMSGHFQPGAGIHTDHLAAQ